MINLDCPFDGIQTHHGNISTLVYKGSRLMRLVETERHSLNVVGTISTSWGLRINNKGMLAEHKH